MLMLNRANSKILRHAKALIIATNVIANDSEAICSVNGKHKGRCFGASNLFKRLLRRAKPLQLPSPTTRSDVRCTKALPCPSLRTTVKQSKQRLLRNVRFLQAHSPTTRSDVKGVKPLLFTSLRGAKRRSNLKTSSPLSLLTSHLSLKVGFSLAEVLVALGIIGVLAAMTILGLINTYQKNSYADGFKKEYSLINNAWIHYINDNGGNIAGGTADTATPTTLATALSNYLKVIKNSSYATASMPKYASLGGTVNNLGLNFGDPNGTRVLTLSDGARIVISTWGVSSAYSGEVGPSGLYKSTENGCFTFYVDINGNKKPNTIGRDAFRLNATVYKLNFPCYWIANCEIYNSAGNLPRCDPSTDQSEYYRNGDLCGLRIMKEGGMNY